MHPDAFTVTHLSQLQLQSHHQTWFSTFLGGQSQGTEDVFLIISNVIPSSLTDSHLLYLKDVCKLPKLTVSINQQLKAERCSQLCHFGVLVQLMSLWDSRWKDCYDDHSLYSVLGSVFPSFANDVIACCGILPESLALAPPLLPFTHVTWARGPSWIFSSIWGCGNTIIQKKSFTISAFKLERSSILKGQGRLTGIRPKEKCNVSVKWVSS